MVTMSETEESRKRNHTPEQESTNKALRGPDNMENHASVLLAKDLINTPTGTARKMSPSSLHRMSPGTAVKIDCEYLYQLCLKLDTRISNQDIEMEQLRIILGERENEIVEVREQLQQNKITTHGTIEKS